jgi:hypothetical protein
MLWDDPEVEQRIKASNMPADMLENNPIPLV